MTDKNETHKPFGFNGKDGKVIIKCSIELLDYLNESREEIDWNWGFAINEKGEPESIDLIVSDFIESHYKQCKVEPFGSRIKEEFICDQYDIDFGKVNSVKPLT